MRFKTSHWSWRIWKFAIQIMLKCLVVFICSSHFKDCCLYAMQRVRVLESSKVDSEVITFICCCVRLPLKVKIKGWKVDNGPSGSESTHQYFQPRELSAVLFGGCCGFFLHGILPGWPTSRVPWLSACSVYFPESKTLSTKLF